MVRPPSDFSACPSPALAVQVVWSQSFGPSCCSYMGCLWGLWCGILSPWPLVAALLLLFSPGFLPLAFVRAGQEGCGPVLVPPFLEGTSPSLVLVFAWQLLLLGCPSSLTFLDLFAGVLSSRFLCLLWLRLLAESSLVLFHPLLGGGRCFTGLCQGTCRLALVGLRRLGSSVLRGPVFMMWSTVSGRDCVFLSPQSYLSLSLLWLGLGSWPSCGVTYIWLAMCSSACDGSGGCSSF